jgi:hypothetical protein
VSVCFWGEVVVEVGEGVEVGDELELDEVNCGTEVDDCWDVELSLEVLDGGGGVDELSLGVGTEDELLKG